MTLRYLIGALAVALLGWIAFKDAIWTAWASRGNAELAPAPDPMSEAGWLLRPDTPPPAVWDSGWGIDVFMLPARPARAGGPVVISPSDAERRSELVERTEVLAEPLSGLGPVYVPNLRLPSPAARAPDWGPARADLAAAFASYLETDNRGRAVLFAAPPGSEPLLGALAAPLSEAPENVTVRMGGLVHFSGTTPVKPPQAICGPSIAERCLVDIPVSAVRAPLAFLSPRLPSAWPAHEIVSPVTARSALTVRRETVLAWLDKNAAREAEPLGGFETIEVAPIRRPGTEPTPDIRGRDN